MFRHISFVEYGSPGITCPALLARNHTPGITRMVSIARHRCQATDRRLSVAKYRAPRLACQISLAKYNSLDLVRHVLLGMYRSLNIGRRVSLGRYYSACKAGKHRSPRHRSTRTAPQLVPNVTNFSHMPTNGNNSNELAFKDRGPCPLTYA